MNPIAMALLLLVSFGVFGVTASRRWRLMQTGGATAEDRATPIAERLKRVWTFGIYQKKMRKYPAAGIAHQLIFLGFIVL
ncbi:MAG TPA: hypothetical protein VL137_05040, partial [Polyangiaceae bacterium]|nr:hypothetical protein [Polyangiaceae bacterium]